MKTLLIMRHAKSSWDNPQLKDFDRPLNNRGLKDAPRAGLEIKKLGLIPQMIICSPALRAKKTAELLMEVWGRRPEMVFEQKLFEDSLQDIYKILKNIPPSQEHVMIIGHNPTLEALTGALTGHYEHIPTAAFAYLELHLDSWEKITRTTKAQRLHFLKPRAV